MEKEKQDLALKYYNENCIGDFESACLPLMIYLSKEHNPMLAAIVGHNGADLVEGITIINNNFIED